MQIPENLTQKEEEEWILEKAAGILGGNHSPELPDMILPLFLKMARNHLNSGGGAHGYWVRALKALGETILTVEKMERR